MILIKIIGVLLLLIALLFIYGFISDKISEKKHREFKKKLEGKALFITTNKKDFESLNYRILQKLDKEIIHVKLVNGRVKSIYDADKIHRLISLKNQKSFQLQLKYGITQ
nr:hypothetical protein [uncultured Flavobacterium sp.]